MVSYDAFATAIVKKMINAIGDQAIQLARDATGIVIDNQGNYLGASKSDLQKLVWGYQKVAGDVAIYLSKKAIKGIGTGKEDLPKELK